MSRIPLPARRPGVTEDLVISGQVVTATVGFDRAGAPKEIFLRTAKPGSAMDALLADAAVAISVALQSGVPASAMRKSMGNLPGATPFVAGDAPASPIGAALDWLIGLEGRT